MSETVLVAFITAASTLFGVLLPLAFDAIKRKSEEKRWYAEFFIGKKLETLNNLYAVLVDSYDTVHYYGNSSPKTLQEFKEKVGTVENTYKRAMAMAFIYLDESGQEAMKETLGAFRQALFAIYCHLPDEEFPGNKSSFTDDPTLYNVDWKLLENGFNGAIEYLKAVLSPKSLLDVAKIYGTFSTTSSARTGK